MDILNKLVNPNARNRNEDGMCDKLNHSYAVFGFVLFTVIGFAKSFGFDPIICHGESTFSGGWIEFIQDTCITNGNFTHLMEGTSSNVVTRWYQWVGYLFLIQAILFMYAQNFWSEINKAGKFMVRPIVNMCKQLEFANAEDEVMIKKIEVISLYFKRGFRKADLSELRASNPIMYCLRHIITTFISSNFLTVSYFLYKLVQLMVIGLSMKIVGMTVGNGNIWFGKDMLVGYYRGNDWQYTGYFPKRVKCIFEADTRTLKGSAQALSNKAECTLASNFTNEIMFLINWLLLAFLFTVTVISMVQWIACLFFQSRRNMYIERLLKYLVCLLISSISYRISILAFHKFE
uniref:Innexin n=1 Tax=Rhabditophanes sp. KR3021 TaxID=114890 RepID=A0AC35THL5_9BILA